MFDFLINYMVYWKGTFVCILLLFIVLHLCECTLCKWYLTVAFDECNLTSFYVQQIGDPKDAVRNGVRALFKQIEQVYPSSKLFAYLMEGLKSKNARQRTGDSLSEHRGIVL